MADSVSSIPKLSDKSKPSNSVSRTTSETLRISEADRGAVQPSSLNVNSSGPKKKTSFQITSVTVGSRMSNDGGEDSADDLDESHTDDVSEVNDASRATDIERETPSYSEDTFSKDDVFFNASASLASAPVIPTSSQYGLAILDSTDTGEVMHPVEVGSNLPDSDLAVVTEKVINLVSAKHDPEIKDSPHTHTTRSERFKVVKIESTEPFKRGRWVCMDYLDHTTSQLTQVNKGENTDPSSQLSQTNQSSNNEAPSSVIELKPETMVSKGSTLPVSTIPVQEDLPPAEPLVTTMCAGTQHDASSQVSNHSPVTSSIAPNAFTSSPGQSLQTNVQVSPTTTGQTMPHGQSLSQVPVQHPVAQVNQHQSLQPQQIQQVIASVNTAPLQQSMPHMQQPIQQMPIPQQQPAQPFQQFQPIQTPQMIPDQLQQTQLIQEQLQQTQMMQEQLQQQQSQLLQEQLQQQQAVLQQQQAAVLQQQIQQAHMQNMPHMGMQGMTVQFGQQPQGLLQQGGMLPGMQSFPMQQMMQPPLQQQYYPGTVGMGQQGVMSMQNFPVAPPTQVPSGYLPLSTHVPNPNNQPSPAIQPVSNMIPPQSFVPIASPAQTQTFSNSTSVGSVSSVSCVPPVSTVLLETTTPSSEVPDSAIPATALLESLVANAADEPPPGEDAESASGASAVAIDNKIEQAMDLVKSHLMFAVREEVEVLKEKISELMERINQLEAENGILRANATQETLAQLPVAPVQPAQPPTQTQAPTPSQPAQPPPPAPAT